jgi:hypothetical protein
MKSSLRNVIQLAVLSVVCFLDTFLHIAVFSVGIYNKFTLNLCGQSAPGESAMYIMLVTVSLITSKNSLIYSIYSHTIHHRMIYASLLLDKFWEKIKYCTTYLELLATNSFGQISVIT